MSMPVVGIDELTTAYEGDLDDDFGFPTEWYEEKLAVAVDKAGSRYGAQMTARLADGRLTSRMYVAVICEAVLRVARNTNGYRSEQEGNYQYEQDASVASGKLFFTDENVEDLTGVNPRRSSKLGTATVRALNGGY